MKTSHALAIDPEDYPDEVDAGMVTLSVIDHISTGVVVMDAAGVITFINSAAERMLRTSRDEAVGKRVDMLPLRTPLYKVLSENCREAPVEISCNGQVLLATSSPVGGAGAPFTGDVLEIRDITEESGSGGSARSLWP